MGAPTNVADAPEETSRVHTLDMSGVTHADVATSRPSCSDTNDERVSLRVMCVGSGPVRMCSCRTHVHRGMPLQTARFPTASV